MPRGQSPGIFISKNDVLILLLDKNSHFLPLFLVLGGILDDFASFCPTFGYFYYICSRHL